MHNLEHLIGTLNPDQLDEKLFDTEEYKELTEMQKNYVCSWGGARRHDLSLKELKSGTPLKPSTLK